MYVNLTDAFTVAGKVERISVPIEMDHFSCKYGEYKLTDKSPVALVLSNVGVGKARMQGQAEVTLGMNCDRCLKQVDQIIHLDFDQEVMAPDVAQPDPDDDDSFVDGYELNVEQLVNTEITVNLPTKVLCKADCKGICRQCGKDLNAGECKCDGFVPDPRLAAIKDIFYGNKEV
ncbi:MAG: DUF177 domain-containing protein [Lachnospiraceae bacterium]|nr:DUF177 domain-containing protein [Lachnospiraceae bacterium]